MNDSTVLTVSEMAEADALAVAGGVQGVTLMEAAGAAVAREITARWEARPTVVLCGPGNNGGDGFVAARLLKEQGWPVRLGLLGDIADLKGDADVCAARWEGAVQPLDVSLLQDDPLVVDALFGAGLARSLGGVVADMVAVLNDRKLDVVAVDLPSGVSGDTGAVLGCAPHATVTVTFFRPKPGHYLMPGRDRCGEVVVCDIGIPETVLERIKPTLFLNGPALWGDRFPWPQPDGHKYDRGHAVIAGGDTMTGAARLAARAARRIGAGIATITCTGTAYPTYAAGDPGTLVAAVGHGDGFSAFLDDDRLGAVLVGPGGGVNDATRFQALHAIGQGKSVVLDADALSVFGEAPPSLFATLGEAADRVLLTPHDGEFRRLFSWQGDRLLRARAASAECGAVVLLKGPDTVIAHPEGHAVINANAPPTLATAGAGDVLAGLAVGLMAQGLDAFDAGCMAAWVQGRAASAFGPGLIAEDLVDAVPRALSALAR